ncbi:MAG: HD domain-containing protein [Planctomycetaceae bacterium]|nr:HD domain-containing protein [Planctomycetaceae bacterium]
MILLRNQNAIDIMERTMNKVDDRLVDHGKRVAYMVYKCLVANTGKMNHDHRNMRNICLLGMLHDVGAYKTEEINNMVRFETEGPRVWDHSIYGYLFMKKFSPLRDWADVLLYHHADCDVLEKGKKQHLDSESKPLNDQNAYLANLISLCDRADVFSAGSRSTEDFLRYAESKSGTVFSPASIDAFQASGLDIGNLHSQMDSPEGVHFREVMYETPMSKNEADAFMHMMICSIEFRSPQTSAHSISVMSVADTLAGLLGASGHEKETMQTAALLHDIGKVCIPIEILEKPDKLTPDEFAIMKQHVNFTKEIIEGCVGKKICDTAVNHHEKINGSGYPVGLAGTEIETSDRILAVADILGALNQNRSYRSSMPKEKSTAILTDAAAKGELDPLVVKTAIEHYDGIIRKMQEDTASYVEAYNAINGEYYKMMSRIHGILEQNNR